MTFKLSNLNKVVNFAEENAEVCAYTNVMRKHGYYLTANNILPYMSYSKKLAIQMILSKWEGCKSKISDEFIELIYSDVENELIELRKL